MVTKVTTEKRNIRKGQISYGKDIAFIAYAPNPQAAEFFKVSVQRLGNGGFTNTQVVIDGNKVYVTGTARPRKKVRVCELIRRHADENKVVIPMWIRSHASFARRKMTMTPKGTTAPAVDNKAVINKVQETLDQSKQVKRKVRAKRQTQVVNNLPEAKPTVAKRTYTKRKVSLFKRFVNWLNK